FGGYRLKASQSHSIAFVFRVARALADVEAMDEQRFADVSGVVPSIELMVAHQHMQPVDAARQTGDGLPATRRSFAEAALHRLNLRRRCRHPSPTRPPCVRGPQALDQHRAGPALDPHPSFAVERGEWKACAQKGVGTGGPDIATRLPAGVVL